MTTTVSKACQKTALPLPSLLPRDGARRRGCLLDKNRREIAQSQEPCGRTHRGTTTVFRTGGGEAPTLGQVRVSNELRKEGCDIYPLAVCVQSGCVINCKPSGTKGSEAKVARRRGVDRSTGCSAAPKPPRTLVRADGEIDDRHPGYLGSQDTFYVLPPGVALSANHRQAKQPTTDSKLYAPNSNHS